MLGGRSDVARQIRRALAHPLRVELIRRFAERTWSPNELAQELGHPLGDVSYHVRELAKAGAIEEVDSRPVRGATEHFYRGLTRAEVAGEEWAAMSFKARREVSETIIRNTYAEILAAFEAGTMDRQIERHLSWRPVVVDEKGRLEIAELLARTLREAEQIEARAAARRTASGEEPATMIVGLQGFERGGRPG